MLIISHPKGADLESSQQIYPTAINRNRFEQALHQALANDPKDASEDEVIISTPAISREVIEPTAAASHRRLLELGILIVT